MNLQRREEIRELANWLDVSEWYHATQYQEAIRELLAHIDTLEQTAAERVIADGKSLAVVALELTKSTVEEIVEAETRVSSDGPFASREQAALAEAGSHIRRLRAIPADRVLGEGMVAARWIPVSESLPEDGESVGFITECRRDDFYNARVYGGRFSRSDWDNGFGGFNTHGLGAQASHWCKLPPIPDTIRANQGGSAT